MAPIAPKRVLENIRPISLADYIPQTAADPKWPHRLDNDRDKRDLAKHLVGTQHDHSWKFPD